MSTNSLFSKLWTLTWWRKRESINFISIILDNIICIPHYNFLLKNLFENNWFGLLTILKKTLDFFLIMLWFEFLKMNEYIQNRKMVSKKFWWSKNSNSIDKKPEMQYQIVLQFQILWFGQCKHPYHEMQYQSKQIIQFKCI